MSKHNRKDHIANTHAILAKIETELAQGYVEVEMEGISFTRLVFIYVAGAREARDRMLNSVRSLFRLHPAQQSSPGA